MDAKEAERIYEWAARLHRAGEDTEALELLAQLHQSFPNDKRLLYAQARCYRSLGDATRAAELCEILIRDHDYERAALLAESLRAGPVAPDDRFDFPQPQVGRRRWLRTAVLAAIGVVASGGAIAWNRSRLRLIEEEIFRKGEEERKDFERDHTRKKMDEWRNRPATLEAERAQALEERLATLQRDRSLPGFEHLEEDWKPTAINGVPVWEPGIYRKVPAIGRPEFSVDVYLPLQYAADPAAAFPCLTICWPSPHSGFQGCEPWAEKN